MNSTPKNIKILTPHSGSHFACHSRCKMRYLAEIVTVESILTSEQGLPEHAKNTPILKVRIAQPPSPTAEGWPKYGALIVQHQEKKRAAWLDSLSSIERPDVLITLDRHDPFAVDSMCDLIDIMRNWEGSVDSSLNHVLRWGSTCEEHEIKKIHETQAWLDEIGRKYLLPTACLAACTNALSHGSALFSKQPMRIMVASDGVFVHCIITVTCKEGVMHPRRLKKILGRLFGHAVSIMKKGDEVHLCVVETLEPIDVDRNHPLCHLICDLSRRIFGKRVSTSKVG